MNISKTLMPLPALMLAVLLASCGGSSGSNQPADAPAPQATTGSIALILTDRASDDFAEINLNVIEAILIGGEGVSQQVLFQGIEPIDLLALENYSEPIIFGEVNPGIYTKLRLVIDGLELVPVDGSPSIYPPLPANGKIDLLDPQGIEVLPGRTLIAEIDMEANKAIHIVGAGKSKQYRFRPVVKATFMDGDLGVLPDRLARLEGKAGMIDAAGSFELCDLETPDSCIDVATNASTSVFDSDGLATDFSTLLDGDTVVVIGNYTVDGSILLNAVILEIGGNAVQIQGEVVNDVTNDEVLLLKNDGNDIVAELQAATRYYDADGARDITAVTLGAEVEVEGVHPAGDADRIRAALVFIEPEEDEQLAGTIANAPDATTRQFTLSKADLSEQCVEVGAEADVLLVDTALSTVTMGMFADLAQNQVVDIFGATVEGACSFLANEVIVDVNASP
ncbi:MAG: DUF4382 domain-containing protein [Gammaproteobacteria bacterium]|nr:DUF4382 domain-containing protein [Gammaproteobacteria bacterium]MDH5304657.1 DUF4382 domain-containing protein [Gammaproteobacteria bacterium]MDH5322599.1 DUF4382 domain-containing protein [Gammaproteobacteria bacterium]